MLDRYGIIFGVDAQLELLAAAEYIAQKSPLTAIRWQKGLEKAIESLSIFPNRCPEALESEFLGETLRNYVYKSYRIIFRVEQETKTVRVLHVRHAARRAIGEPTVEDE